MLAATLQIGSLARAQLSLGAAQPIVRIGWDKGNPQADTHALKGKVRFEPPIAPLDMQQMSYQVRGDCQLHEKMLFLPARDFGGGQPLLLPVPQRTTHDDTPEFKLTAFETVPPTRLVARGGYLSVYRSFGQAELEGRVSFLGEEQEEGYDDA